MPTPRRQHQRPTPCPERRRTIPFVLDRPIGRDLSNPQILVHDGNGELLAINRVLSSAGLEQW